MDIKYLTFLILILIGGCIDLNSNADKTLLKEVINESKILLSETEIGTLAGQTLEENYNKLQSEITFAELVIKKDDVNQEKVDKTKKELVLAKNEFKENIIPKGNKENLEQLISESESLLKKIEVGNLAGQILLENHEAFEQEISKAKQVLNDEKSNQEMVDLAEEKLNLAKETFNNNIILEGNKEELKNLIIDSEDLLLEVTIGDLAGQVSENVHMEFSEKVEEAKVILTDDSANQMMVEEAFLNLQDSKDKFQSKIIPEGNKEKLKEIIIESEDLIEVKVIGQNIGNISQNAKDNFLESISNAKQVFDDKSASQKIVDNEEQLLLEAKEKLLKSEVSIIITDQSQKTGSINLFGIDCYNYDFYFQVSERTSNFHLNEGSEPKNIAKVADCSENKTIIIKGYVLAKSSVDSGNINQITVKTHDENGEILEIKSFYLPE